MFVDLVSTIRERRKEDGFVCMFCTRSPRNVHVHICDCDWPSPDLRFRQRDTSSKDNSMTCTWTIQFLLASRAIRDNSVTSHSPCFMPALHLSRETVPPYVTTKQLPVPHRFPSVKSQWLSRVWLTFLRHDQSFGVIWTQQRHNCKIGNMGPLQRILRSLENY